MSKPLVLASLFLSFGAILFLIIASAGGTWSKANYLGEKFNFGLLSLNAGGQTADYDGTVKTAGQAISAFLVLSVMLLVVNFCFTLAVLLDKFHRTRQYLFASGLAAEIFALFPFVIWVGVSQKNLQDQGPSPDVSVTLAWCWVLSLLGFIWAIGVVLLSKRIATRATEEGYSGMPETSNG